MTAVTERLEQLEKNARRSWHRHARRWLIVLAVVLLAILLCWLVEFSSVLGVRTVTVVGAKQVSVSRIDAAAAVRPGTPLARLDTAGIQARVAALPEVRSVVVQTSYPSTVRIEVTERVAVGYRANPDGAGLVDVNNIQFRTTPKPPAGLPRLAMSADPEISADLATVAAALPPALARKVALISATDTQSITLTLIDGRTVLWGATDDSTDKARILTALIGQPGNYFDISDPSAVISRGN